MRLASDLRSAFSFALHLQSERGNCTLITLTIIYLFAGLQPERQGPSSRYSYLLLFDTIYASAYCWPESGETNLLGAYKCSYGYRSVGILSAPIQVFTFLFVAIAYLGIIAYSLTRDGLIPKRLFCAAMHCGKYLSKYGGLFPETLQPKFYNHLQFQMASDHESTESS